MQVAPNIVLFFGVYNINKQISNYSNNHIPIARCLVMDCWSNIRFTVIYNWQSFSWLRMGLSFFSQLNCYLYLQLSFTILALVIFFWGMAKTFLGWQQKEIVYAGKTLTQESSMSSHLTRWNKCLNNYNELSKLLQIRFSIN